MTRWVTNNDLQMNCWNEAAVVAGCDPNTDDDCLCGPFFGAVTSCTAGACSIGENLGTSISFVSAMTTY